MGLGPNPDNYPKRERDPGYKAAIADMAENPDRWNATAPGGAPTVMTPISKKDEKTVDKANERAEKAERELAELKAANADVKKGGFGR